MKITKDHLKAAGYLIALLAIAPFALEFLLLAEFVGLEFAFTFMVFYFRNLYQELILKWWRFKQHLSETIDDLLQLLMFQPKTYGLSATASCVFILFTGSTLLACGIWLPAMLLSTGIMT